MTLQSIKLTIKTDVGAEKCLLKEHIKLRWFNSVSHRRKRANRFEDNLSAADKVSFEPKTLR